MISKTEKIICKNIRALLKLYEEGAVIQDSEYFREVLSALEYYIPSILSSEYPFWQFESLDGVYEQKSVKIMDNELQLIGMVLLITDQTLTPFHIFMRISETSDKFDFVKCKVGEKTLNEMLKIPYDSSKWGGYMSINNINNIDWFYEIEVSAD